MSRIYDRDPYAVLGISSSASASQIKEAYHRLARQYHPDLNKDPRAAERMKEINWAYDILSDPQERSLYHQWRSSNISTEYYYPGSSPSDPATPASPPSAGRQTRDPLRGNPYGNGRVNQNSSSMGCYSWGVIWIIILIVTNVVRALGSSWSQRPSYDYSPEYRAAQTAQMERIESSLQTLKASQSLPTVRETDRPSNADSFISTPTLKLPVIIPTENGGQEDLRSGFVPGSWRWEQLHQNIPELTTPDGLSDEVTSITYDRIKGYHIQTRSLGEFWLYIDLENHTVSGIYYPPVAVPTSTP